MTDKSKAIGAAFAVLLIGVAIGALVVGPMLARHHFKRADRAHGQEGFVSMMEERIKPDPAQVEVVREILTRYGDRLEGLRTRQHDKAVAVFDSLDAELATVLTAEQKERIDRSKRKGPHPGEPR